QDVVFHYRGHHQPLYEGLSVTIGAGEKVGLVGLSGSGKTTFVKLIQRLYDVTDGRILIDGQNVSHATQGSLRSQIAIVQQEPILFHRSLSENIAYGRPGATAAEVRRAAAAAYADEFIARLPRGYDTVIGERGITLSGGQRQRLAIARALLRDTPLLILDEATSSLDIESERFVQAALDSLMAGRTCLVIAHRLSTVRRADTIAVLKAGRIVERGDHETLLAAGGEYARQWDMQFAEGPAPLAAEAVAIR
ncbi:MAG TPA: ATP-binding cassette domain-containing protein, partial [Myxococcota bacterium]|nr:ATP-binding cassette domain-containing protein [Myxococcota bacterium]